MKTISLVCITNASQLVYNYDTKKPSESNKKNAKLTCELNSDVCKFQIFLFLCLEASVYMS